MQRISRKCISSIQDSFQASATKTILHQWTRQQQPRANQDFARKIHTGLTGTGQLRCTRHSILGSLFSSTPAAKRIKSTSGYSRLFSGSSACRLNDGTSDTGSSSQHRLTSELPTKGRMVLDTSGMDVGPIRTIYIRVYGE